MKVAETSFLSVTETSTFVNLILCHLQIKKNWALYQCFGKINSKPACVRAQMCPVSEVLNEVFLEEIQKIQTINSDSWFRKVLMHC